MGWGPPGVDSTGRGRGLGMGRWGHKYTLGLDIKAMHARSGHHSTLMLCRELSLDLLPSPFCCVDRSSREFTVGPSLFDKFVDPFRTVVLRNFAVWEGIGKVAIRRSVSRHTISDHEVDIP